MLQELLCSHPDTAFVDNLVDGLTHGFHTGFAELPQSSKECKNLLSAMKDPETTAALISSELSKGFLIGPYSQSPFHLHRINPIGVVQGKYSLKHRLIVDLSAPHNDPEHPSLNSLINKEDFSLSYVRVDDAVSVIKKLGPGTYMCKTDIADAFKQIPIHPTLWHLHGIQWDQQYYFYTRLVFGSRSSPKLFDLLSQAACWLATNRYGIPHILHLLDDFICFEPTLEAGRSSMANMLQLFADLDIPLSSRKTVGPSQCLEYLGIILDSVHMESRLPQEKIDRLVMLLDSVSMQAKVTKRQLLVLLGHMNYAMQVVRPGRSFMSFLITKAHSVRKLHHCVSLNRLCRLDLQMWKHFLANWNGVTLFLEDVISAPDFTLYTDASSTQGFGGYFQGQWFNGAWPDKIKLSQQHKLTSMALLELYPIVNAAVIWGHLWAKKSIRFYCDNQATVDIINKGRSKCATIMSFMRRLTLVAAKCNFMCAAVHVPGKSNDIADALSRFQMTRFRQLAPQADLRPSPNPPISLLQYP